MEVSHTIRNNTVKIYFNGILHLWFNREDVRGVWSWQYGENQFAIEIRLRKTSLTPEYDTKEKWTAVLAELDRVLP
jgi:hypothetical protein